METDFRIKSVMGKILKGFIKLGYQENLPHIDFNIHKYKLVKYQTNHHNGSH